MTEVLLCDLSLAPTISLALSSPGRRPGAVSRGQCTTRQAFDDTVTGFLADHQNPGLIGAALSARGWEQTDGLHLVGVDFTLDRESIRSLLGIQRVNFLNNFVARALAVPGLGRDDRIQICGGEITNEHAIAVLGPHHGLGLAALVSDGMGGWTALHGEGGHSDLPVKTEREWRIAEAIREKNGYVSRESGISVSGLADIWHALHVIAGVPVPALSSHEIIEAARGGSARAREAIDVMTAWLGAMASDVALIMGTSGGVYLTGALLDMIGDLFDAAVFTQRYLDKGPRSGYVADIPVFRTRAADMELAGLATLYD